MFLQGSNFVKGGVFTKFDHWQSSVFTMFLEDPLVIIKWLFNARIQSVGHIWLLVIMENKEKAFYEYLLEEKRKVKLYNNMFYTVGEIDRFIILLLE